MQENYEQYQTDYTDVVDAGAAGYIGTQADFQPAVQMGFASPRAMKRLMADAEVSAGLAMGRALLAKTSLNNLAVLSHAEEVLSEIAPTGAARYKAICDALAYADGMAVMNFGGGGKK